MFDGATDVSVCENEIVYAQVVVEGVPHCVYIKTQPVEHAHAEGVLGAIETAMSSVDDWKNKLIATGCDGANVNMGKRHSVIAFLKRDVPLLIPIHCDSHRLELGALDATKDRDAAMFSDKKSVLLYLHKHYHYSAKAMRELQELAEAMEQKSLKPTNLYGTRWMPHFSRALEILLKSYTMFVNHLKILFKEKRVLLMCRKGPRTF